MSREQAVKRAELMAKIRTIFINKNILEVETPLLSHATVTSPYIDSFTVAVQLEKKKHFLSTNITGICDETVIGRRIW
jgi:lysyl-tRNA synthetase class 2